MVGDRQIYTPDESDPLFAGLGGATMSVSPTCATISADASIRADMLSARVGRSVAGVIKERPHLQSVTSTEGRGAPATSSANLESPQNRDQT